MSGPDSLDTRDAPAATLVTRYLFSPLHAPRGIGDVIAWWERRRPLFNVAVGTAGLLTMATAFLLRLLPAGDVFEGPPLRMVAVYAVIANVCFSIGAPIHLLLRRWLRERAGPVAQALFRYGLAFGVGVTLLPIPVLLVSATVRLFLLVTGQLP